ncbi:uncharacterized protein O3C94_003970, partial [Discoglossus pictus]
AAIYQRTCFSRAEAVELKEAEGSDTCNLSCSSSWSLASSNDKDADRERAQRGRTQTLLRRVKSLRGRAKSNKVSRLRGLRRFLSRSEENLPVSAVGAQEGKSRSLERSLVFKEPAEVLAPRKSQRSPCPHPLKSILKHPGPLNLNTEAKFSPRRKPERQRSPLALSPAHGDLGRDETPSPDRKSQQDKAKFSQFLDEITSRVLSPASRGSRRRVPGGSTDEESPTFSSRTSAEGDGPPRDLGERVEHRRARSPGQGGDGKRTIEKRKRTKCRQAECPHGEPDILERNLREESRAKPLTVVSKDKTSHELGFLETESLSSASHWSPEGKTPSPRTSPSFNHTRNKVMLD